jgi:hypothetical protein
LKHTDSRAAAVGDISGGLRTGSTLGFIAVRRGNCEDPVPVGRERRAVGGSRRRQRGSGTERDAPRPMNRDVPPCTRALRAALQPLIGGAMECYRRAVALVRKRRLLFSRMRMAKHRCSHIAPSCLLVLAHRQSITTATSSSRGTADRRPLVTCPSHLISHTIRPSRVANTGDQPARAPVALSLHHRRRGQFPIQHAVRTVRGHTSPLASWHSLVISQFH